MTKPSVHGETCVSNFASLQCSVSLEVQGQVSTLFHGCRFLVSQKGHLSIPIPSKPSTLTGEGLINFLLVLTLQKIGSWTLRFSKENLSKKVWLDNPPTTKELSGSILASVGMTHKVNGRWQLHSAFGFVQLSSPIHLVCHPTQASLLFTLFLKQAKVTNQSTNTGLNTWHKSSHDCQIINAHISDKASIWLRLRYFNYFNSFWFELSRSIKSLVLFSDGTSHPPMTQFAAANRYQVFWVTDNWPFQLARRPSRVEMIKMISKLLISVGANLMCFGVAWKSFMRNLRPRCVVVNQALKALWLCVENGPQFMQIRYPPHQHKRRKTPQNKPN